jgi:hypothetical protein
MLSSARVSFAQEPAAPWINTSAADEYVSNFLNWMNTLILQHYSPDVASQYFLLYHPEGQSFRVEVVSCLPNNYTIACLLFTPIVANEPDIVIDPSNTSLPDVAPGFLVKAPNFTLASITIISHDRDIPVNLMFSVLASNILTNTDPNSYSEAVYFYNQEKQDVPPPNYFRITLDTLTTIWAKVFYVLIVASTLLYLYRDGVLPYVKPPSKKKGKKR